MDKIKFKVWILASEIQEKLYNSILNKKLDDVARYIVNFTEIVSNKANLIDVAWYDIVPLYVESIERVSIKLDIPFLSGDGKERKKDLEYKDRTWYSMAHIIAKQYGWKLEYIANLDVVDALSMIQEIIMDEQLQKEWEWGLSEVAYQYDKATKTSKLVPLPRPKWMIEGKKEEVKSVKLPRNMIPAGIVVMAKDTLNESAKYD